MPTITRTNSSGEIWNAVSEAGVILAVDPVNESTVATAVTAGDETVEVGAGDGAGFEVGDLIRIGTGDTLEVGEVEAVATDTLTLVTPVAFDHAVGEEVAEQAKQDVGHVAEGGVTHDVSEDTFEVRAATAQGVLVERTTGVTQNLSWPGILWSPENLATAFGIPAADIYAGDGTATDPTAIRLLSDRFNAVDHASIYFQGVREDGTFVEVRGWNVKFDLNRTSTFARNAVAELPIGGRVDNLEALFWA